MSSNELPEWIKPRKYDKQQYLALLNLLRQNSIHTVCIEADCPNRYECFARGTATFLILGNICTRDCKYCGVQSGHPKPPDPDTPGRIARAVRQLGLRYVVITCVSRDDLEDGGASVFVDTVNAIRELCPSKVELLISDLNGNKQAIKKIIQLHPDVLNHNIEVASPLFAGLRPQGDYKLSLSILKYAKQYGLITKSGLMLGLGETDAEILGTLRELRAANVDILTIGQYLQPSKAHALVKKYYTPNEFSMLRQKAYGLGFQKVEAGPLVRSSYNAGV